MINCRFAILRSSKYRKRFLGSVSDTPTVKFYTNILINMSIVICIEKLKVYGIEAVIKADDEGGFHPGMAMVSGVRIFVDEEDEARAKDLLLPMDKTNKSMI